MARAGAAPARPLPVFLCGLAAGLVIAVLTVAVEHSRVAFGPFSLYGNGALIVPGLGAPLAIYFGWLRLAGPRAAPPVLGAAVYAAGVDVGIGFGSVIDQLVAPQADATLESFVASVLLSGIVFVLPTAALAALVIWLFASGRVPLNAFTLAAAFVAGAPLVLLLPLVPMGLMTGAGIAAAARARSAVMTGVIAAVMVVLLVSPFALLLFREPV